MWLKPAGGASGVKRLRRHCSTGRRIDVNEKQNKVVVLRIEWLWHELMGFCDEKMLVRRSTGLSSRARSSNVMPLIPLLLHRLHMRIGLHLLIAMRTIAESNPL
jgi:hypothetical protein